MPQLSISFSSEEYAQKPPVNTVIAGVPFLGEILLNSAWQGEDQDISLTISPPVIEANPDTKFPTSLRLLHGNSIAQFKYTFTNQSVVAGNPQDTTQTVSASSTSPYQSFLVTASLPPNPAQPCFDWEVMAPVRLINQVLAIYLYSGTPGDAPVWNTRGGGQLNADSTYAPQDVSNSAQAEYTFPALPSAVATTAPVTLYLYDDQRQLHSTSDVWVTFESGPSVKLAPFETVEIPIPLNNASYALTVQWRSKGPTVNYSSQFFLVMDGGTKYGQTEFWLSVWNWS